MEAYHILVLFQLALLSGIGNIFNSINFYASEMDELYYFSNHALGVYASMDETKLLNEALGLFDPFDDNNTLFYDELGSPILKELLEPIQGPVALEDMNHPLGCSALIRHEFNGK